MVSDRMKQVLSAVLYGVTSIAIMTTNKAVLTTFQYAFLFLRLVLLRTATTCVIVSLTCHGCMQHGVPALASCL